MGTCQASLRLRPPGGEGESDTVKPMTTVENVAPPRCRMCARSARWNKVREEWSAYCSGMTCSNRDRLCQRCGGAFAMGVGEAGTKYCSIECKAAGYHPTANKYMSKGCAWCGRPGHSSG